MKTRNLKITLLSLVMALVAFISLGVLGFTPARAETFAPTKDDFYMLDGAQIRDAEDSSGIRFVAYLSDAYVNSLGEMGVDYKVGMAIIPRSVLGETVSADDLDENTPNVALQEVGGFVADDNPNAKEGYNAYTMSLVNIPNTIEDWQDKTVANAYVKDLKTNTYTFVTDITDGHAQERDIATVATNAYADGFEADIVDTIVQNVSVGKTVELSAEKLSNSGSVVLGIGGNATVSGKVMSGTDETAYAVKYTSSNPSVATVDSTGKITAKTNGSVTITASFGSATDTLSAKVYKDTVYDYENTNYSEELFYDTTTSLTQHGKSKTAGDLYYANRAVDESHSVIPTEFGNNCIGLFSGASSGQKTFGISMDYLEYAFLNANIACVTFDIYSNSPDDQQIIWTYNFKNSGADTARVASGAISTFAIWREDFLIMKAHGDTELKLAFYTNKQLYRGYVDNLKMVTWDELFGTDNAYGFENDFVNVNVSDTADSKTGSNGIIWSLAASRANVNGVVDYGAAGNKAVKGTSTTDWAHYGFSMEFLDWAFGVKNATSVTFEITSSKDGPIYVCRGVGSADSNALLSSTTANTTTTVTISKTAWTQLKDKKASVTDDEYVSFLNFNTTRTATRVNTDVAAMQVGFRVTPLLGSGSSKGGISYFDNIKLVF